MTVEQQSGSGGAVNATSRRDGRPTPRRFALASRANERLQIDHTQLDLRVRIEVDGAWQAVRPWCGVALGEFSRSVAACVLSAGQPDQLTVGLLLTQAFLPKNVWLNIGTPDAIQIDNGNAVTADSIAAFGTAFGITIDLDPPRVPNRESRVERWFWALDRELLRALPGHMEAISSAETAGDGSLRNLLTLLELRAEIYRWIGEKYQPRVVGLGPDDGSMEDV